MSKANLIYFNQLYLDHPKVQTVLNDYNYDWQSLSRRAKWETGMNTLYTRSGINNLPFKNTIAKFINAEMPRYDNTFNLTFAECVDKRVLELSERLADKKWQILWSGGIDSTCVFLAIIKNLHRSYWENIEVVCNRFSIYENPNLYYNFIKPNFQVKEYYNHMSTENLDRHYIIDGNPCDNLFMSGNVIEILGNRLDNYTKPWRTNKDYIVQLFSPVLGKQASKWFVDFTSESLASTNVPNQTIFDFLWWTRFNQGWINQRLKTLAINTSVNYQSYCNGYVQFFDTHDFEQWSMNNNSPELKYGLDFSDYKKVVKQYIYDIDHNHYYFNYKTKGHSSTVSARDEETLGAFALLDDGTVVNLKTNLDDIIDLLPNHIQIG